LPISSTNFLILLIVFCSFNQFTITFAPLFLCKNIVLFYLYIFTYKNMYIYVPEPQSHSITTKKQVSGLNASTKKLCAKSSVKYDWYSVRSFHNKKWRHSRWYTDKILFFLFLRMQEFCYKTYAFIKTIKSYFCSKENDI